MRYFNNDVTINYTQDLLKAGIIHDMTLEAAFEKKKLEMIYNPWFELSRKGQDDGIIFDYLDDGLKELFRISRKGGITTAGEAIDEVLDSLDTKAK